METQSVLEVRGLADVEERSVGRPNHVDNVGCYQKMGLRLPSAARQSGCQSTELRVTTP